MNQSEWYEKLLEWSRTDKRLERLPYVLMVVLSEHLENSNAAEQGVQRMGFHAWLQGFVFGAVTALLVVAVEIAHR